MTAIEVLYNCKDKEGQVNISMAVTSDSCNPFTITWIKHCSAKITNKLKLNIGITPSGTDIMKDGEFTNIIKAHDPKEKFVIPKHTSSFTIYFSTVTEENLKMKEPVLIFNEQDYTTFVKGDLVKGGALKTTPQSYTVSFGCHAFKKSTTDLELELEFVNNQSLKLFFAKECDTIEEIQEYFNILYVIYWILLILIVVFLAIVILYYLKRNEITYPLLLEKIKETLINAYHSAKLKYDNIKNKMIDKYESKYGQISKKRKMDYSNMESKLYEESDLNETKIIIDKDKNGLKKDDSYGGI